MKRNTVIKNKNTGYYIVAYHGGRIFDEITGAEEYCDKHNLDPNVFIITGTLEIFKSCQTIAGISITALQSLREVLDNHRNESRKLLETDTKNRDKYENSLGGSYYTEEVVRSIGICSGISDAIEKLDEEMKKYKNIRRAQFSGNKDV